MPRETPRFHVGDRVIVVRVRPFLNHAVGDIAIVARANYGGGAHNDMQVIDVMWSDGITTTVYANQFELAPEQPIRYPMEDTRDYLSAITMEGENNVKL